MAIFLKKLELLGFKSFPDKTTIKFHPGITAIIGPNGCGKSNIVDAILWVLGEQKIKHLRADDSEDLIFSGSARKKPYSYTEVRLTIANEKEETEIARKLFRNGETKYLLNERQQRLKDIQNQLYQLQIGDRNYFVFEQGSIDKVIAMKPQERRMLIEEAAGIALYLERKKEIATKLIVAEQNLEQLHLVIQEKEKRLKALRKQLHFVERYRSLKKERQQKLFILLGIRFQNIENLNQQLHKQLTAVNNQELQLLQLISQKEHFILEKEEFIWKEKQLLHQKRDEQLSINSSLNEKDKELTRLKQLVEFKNREVQNQKKEAEQLQQEQKQLEQQQQTLPNDDFCREIERLKAEEAKLNAMSKEKLAELEKKREEEHLLKKQFFTLNSQLSELQNTLQRKERLSTQLETTLHHLDASAQKIADRLQTLQQEKNSDQLKKLAAEKETLLSEQKKILDQQRQITERLLQVQKEETVTKQALADLQSRINSFRQLKEQISPACESDTNRKKLADEIKSNPGYQELIENFFYDELDAYFISSPQEITSEQGSFLLSRKRQPLNKTELKKLPGFRAFVSELFSTEDNNLKTSLKDGIIVENLDQAWQIFNQFEIDILTPDGVYLNRNGVVFCKRTKGILKINETIRQLQGEIPQKEQELDALAKKIQQLQSESREKQKESADLELKLKKIDSEILKIQAGINFLAAEEEKLLKEQKALRAEKELTVQQKTELNNELNNLQKAINELKKELQDIASKQETIAGSKNSTTSDQQNIQQQLSRLKGEISLLTEKEQFRKREEQNLQQQLKKISLRLKEIELTLQQETKTITDSREQIEQLQKKIAGLKENRNQLQQDLLAIENGITEAEKKNRQEQQELNLLRKSLEQLRQEKKDVEISLNSAGRDRFTIEEQLQQEFNLSPEKFTELLKEQEIPPINPEELHKEVLAAEQKIAAMREDENLNLAAESEYELLNRDFQFLRQQQDDILASIKNMKQAIDKIDLESEVNFRQTFNFLEQSFAKNFQLLFNGGEAKLILNNETNLLESGIEIQAQPPGKRLQSLRLLSGGEKTLTSLAFLFSLFEYRPSPFCLFDEVDASLDEANIERFLNFMKKSKEKTQFLLITHNFKTMEEADFLYGISMEEPGVSRIYSMKLGAK